jgi:hypothetical protein
VRPGAVGGVLVVVAGVAAAGAVWVRDGAQLSRAQQARDDGARLLGQGELEPARGAFEEALVAADTVGGATGRREAALDIADEARGALALLDALASPSPRDVLVASPPSAPAPQVQALLDRAQAETLVDAGLALEARGAVELAPRVLTLAAEAARAATSPRLAEVEAALGRAQLRGDLRAAEQSVRQARDAEAETQLRALEERVKGGALAAFPEAEQAEVRGRLEVASAEVADRQGVKRYEEAVGALSRRVPTNDLGRLLPEATALAAPTLRGGHLDAVSLKVRLDAARGLHEKVTAAAREFEDMVLVRRDGGRLVFVDRTEVTNEAYAKFVAAGGYQDTTLWTPEAQPLVERFKDQTRKPGPDAWRDGAPADGAGRLPVAGVCVHEALAFAAWRGKRLPSLVDWQAAAIGEGGTDPYPWGATWRAGLANVRDGDARPTGTRPVGSFPDGAGPSGAVDTIGNVRELVPDGADVFAVGGSFKLRATDATAQSKLKVYPLTIRPDDVGFRCARDLTWNH